jgi:hypothetical protein
MIQNYRKPKTIFTIGAIILIALNLCTLVWAYPETYTPSPGINTKGTILAKDFSAYYVGAWRLWNNPSQIYHFGALGGAEPFISPYPEAYKYLPSFLLLISPLATLDYQVALTVFDILQFMLLPAIAFMLYKLLDGKRLAVALAIATIALLLPFPTLNWGPSLSYYWQWGEGQAKVILTFLLLLSFYLGKNGKPFLSGIALAFGFFDVRFGLLALPLFIMYNRQNIKVSSIGAVATLAVSNVVLLSPGMGNGFLGMVLNSGITTPLYYYALIPFLTLMSLIAVNFKELVAAFDYKEKFSGFTKAVKQ